MVFQVGCDESWKPIFMTSSAPLLADYLTPINLWMADQEDRPEFSILDLLNHLVAQFNEFQNQVMQGNVSADTSAKLAEELAKMMQQNVAVETAEKKIKQEEEEEENVAGGATPVFVGLPAAVADQGAPAMPPAIPREFVVATADSFEDEIFPALRNFLQGENFRAYEVEEWVRRVRNEVEKGNLDVALRIVRDDAMNGGPLPESVQKYYQEAAEPLLRRFERMHRERNQIRYNRAGLTDEAADRLQVEAEGFRDQTATKLMGFTATPIGNVLSHWEITIVGDSIDPSSPLGMQLVEWTLHHGRMDGLSNSNVVRPTDVQLEMLMPVDFPNRGPTLRLIAPRFKDVHRLNLSLSSSQSSMNSDPRSTLTVSTDMESPGVWDSHMSLQELIQVIRSRLESAEVDLGAGKDGSLATLGGFWRTYTCVSPVAVGRPEAEHSGQITLPSSALAELFNNQGGGGGFARRHMMGSGGLQQSGGPMTFEISSMGGRRSFCGVVEFTAEEGTVIVPDWMAKNLGVSLGEEVHVRRVYVPKGIYMKLQPHDARYAAVGDTKRMLEWVLSRYTAVAAGDTLVVNYRGQDHQFDILDVSPGRAIRLIDSDVAVELAPPLSGEEIPKIVDDEAAGGDASSLMKPESDSASISVPETPGHSLISNQVAGEEGVDWNSCPNCRRAIPILSFDRHTLQCARLTWFCELCQVAVEKRAQQEHLEQLHASIFCDCGHECEIRDLEAHKSSQCPLRSRPCDFCKLEMPNAEMRAHEQMCGSKTEKCEQCGLYIQMRDLSGHADVCGIADQSMPPRRFNYGEGGGDDWGGAPVARARKEQEYLMCPHCQQPCEHLDDLQVHLLISHPELAEADAKEEAEEQAKEAAFEFEPPSDKVQFKE